MLPMRTLNQLKSGETSKIRAWAYYDGMWYDGFERRMNALGLDIGKEIKVLRKGWFRPIHLQVGMTELFIRKKDAQNIWVD